MYSPEVQALFDAVATLHPKAAGFDGVVVRSVAIKYAGRDDFYSGVGAAKSGGRWNPLGVEAIYASLDVRTATEEAYQNFNTFGFSLTAIQPRVTAGAMVSLNKVLDLTSAKIRAALGFAKDELCDEDWRAIQQNGEESWTQTIGRGSVSAGFEGLIVPSARLRTGKNIVIYPENLGADSQIRILAADQLPE